MAKKPKRGPKPPFIDDRRGHGYPADMPVPPSKPAPKSKPHD